MSEIVKEAFMGELVKQKLEIEARIAELGEILKSEGNVGMSGNLIDIEGYPRADVDIYKIRLTRQEINCLQNDYKGVINKINDQGFSLTETNRDVIQHYNNFSSTQLKSFLKISHVDENSPSSKAGFQKDDEILQFGPFTAANSSGKLNEIAEHVKERENKIILVKALRKVEGNNEILRFKLTPEKWSGFGLLGCKLNYV